MNKCIFCGRISNDPEVRYTAGENPMAIINFSVAVSKRFKREGDAAVDFFNFTAFGKQAEFIGKYFTRGSRILVSTHAQIDQWDDRDGKKRSTVKFIVEEVDFADGAKKQTDEGKTEGWNPANDEELPFNFDF